MRSEDATQQRLRFRGRGNDARQVPNGASHCPRVGPRQRCAGLATQVRCSLRRWSNDRSRRERLLTPTPAALVSGVALSSFPACVVPVPTQVGCICGHRHAMTHPLGNFTVASGAQVDLRCLVGLNPSHFHRPVEPTPDVAHGAIALSFDQPRNAQATRERATTNAAATNTMSVRRLTRLRVASNPTASLCIVGS